MVEDIKCMCDDELILPKGSWGVHVSMDCKAGNSNVKSYTAIKAFCEDLIEKIGMEAYGNCDIVHFGKPHASGYTLSQLITTSNICAHFVDATGDFYLDVFSCKNVDEEVVKAVVYKWFSPEKVVSKCIIRGLWGDS